MIIRRSLCLLSCALVSGCAVGHLVTGLVAYSNPQRLVGAWVDSALATPTDTVAWVLGPRGVDQRLARHFASTEGGAAKWNESLDGYGYWYVPGRAATADTGRICFRSRARGRDACFPYQLGTAQAAADGAQERPRKRLLIVAYQGQHHTRDRVLIER